MQDAKPLDENEIEQLNQLLFDYSEQVSAAHGDSREEGLDCVFSVSELDGFLTALLTGPEPQSPTVWLPALWDGFMPEFASREAAGRRARDRRSPTISHPCMRRPP